MHCVQCAYLVHHSLDVLSVCVPLCFVFNVVFFHSFLFFRSKKHFKKWNFIVANKNGIQKYVTDCGDDISRKKRVANVSRVGWNYARWFFDFARNSWTQRDRKRGEKISPNIFSRCQMNCVYNIFMLNCLKWSSTKNASCGTGVPK